MSVRDVGQLLSILQQLTAPSERFHVFQVELFVLGGLQMFVGTRRTYGRFTFTVLPIHDYNFFSFGELNDLVLHSSGGLPAIGFQAAGEIDSCFFLEILVELFRRTSRLRWHLHTQLHGKSILLQGVMRPSREHLLL